VVRCLPILLISSMCLPLSGGIRSIVASQLQYQPKCAVQGHSLGGALATLCAHDLRAYLGLSANLVSVYTFGSPRVGNNAFCSRYDELVPSTFRVVNAHDIVTKVGNPLSAVLERPIDTVLPAGPRERPRLRARGAARPA
jgi:hypothetical protein